jgi:hypothetical protein
MTNRNPLAVKLKLCGTYSLSSKPKRYCARRVPLGFGMMFGAGTLTGLLGIGSGAVKVLAMDQVMGLPFRYRLQRATS